MSAWVIVATVIGSWCALSVLVGIVLGHAIAGRPLRHRSTPVAAGVGRVDGATEVASAPTALLADAFAGDKTGLKQAV